MVSRQIGLLGIGLFAVAFAAGRYSVQLTEPGALVTTDEFRQALESRDWVFRARTIGGFVEGLAPENLAPALEAIEDRKRWLSQDELRLFMSAWASFDPSGAFERTLGWPDHTRSKGAAAAIYGWALRDPAAARSAAMTVSDSYLRALLFDRIVAAWAHGPDRPGVTRYIADLPPNPSRDRLTSILIREILADGPEAVMEWAEALPKESGLDFKTTAFEKATGILAQSDPLAAREFVERNLDAPWAGKGAGALARRWVNLDPLAAFAWVRKLPAADARDRAIRLAFNQWQKNNPLAAESWLFAAEGEELDPARLLVVGRLAATSPQKALDVSGQIVDPVTRKEIQVSLLRDWIRVEPDAARRWLATSPHAYEVEAELGSGDPERALFTDAPP